GTASIHAEIAAAQDGNPAEAGSVAKVRIADTGPGIPAENVDRVFDPYFTTKEGGTGLGLALAHKVIQDHHGSIRAENAPGAGAIFVITLPTVRTAS
ncbi:MAG TPA: ATP-binding protein, partial [Candidatus Acidoferrum sp.]|nr:ATP-binding protein [Candidatus Acidoferrum sp.]